MRWYLKILIKNFDEAKYIKKRKISNIIVYFSFIIFFAVWLVVSNPIKVIRGECGVFENILIAVLFLSVIAAIQMNNRLIMYIVIEIDKIKFYDFNCKAHEVFYDDIKEVIATDLYWKFIMYDKKIYWAVNDDVLVKKDGMIHLKLEPGDLKNVKVQYEYIV